MPEGLTFSQIKETCLYIKDLDKAILFYHQKLGLPVISKVKGRHVFFRAGSSVLLCFIAEATQREKTLPPHFAQGKQHVAFGIKAEDYERWKAKIREAGIAITHEQEWSGGLFSFYFNDPEENVLEVIPNEVWDD